MTGTERAALRLALAGDDCLGIPGRMDAAAPRLLRARFALYIRAVLRADDGNGLFALVERIDAATGRVDVVRRAARMADLAEVFFRTVPGTFLVARLARPLWVPEVRS